MATITPEEKLLSIIKQTQNKLKFKKELKLFTKINVVLISLTLIIMLVFLLDIFVFDNNISDINVDLYKKEVEVLPIEEDKEEPLPEILIDKKEVSIPKEELVKDLALLGIITGNNNQAIIEDKKAQKTFFLYKGDSLGEFTVYDIKENEVILDYKGEKVELKI